MVRIKMKQMYQAGAGKWTQDFFNEFWSNKIQIFKTNDIRPKFLAFKWQIQRKQIQQAKNSFNLTGHTHSSLPNSTHFWFGLNLWQMYASNGCLMFCSFFCSFYLHCEFCYTRLPIVWKHSLTCLQNLSWPQHITHNLHVFVFVEICFCLILLHFVIIVNSKSEKMCSDEMAMNL